MKNFKNLLFLILALFIFLNCSTDGVEDSTAISEQLEENPNAVTSENLEESGFYFPPLDSDTWETINPQELNWNTAAEEQLYALLEEKGTMVFLILKDGKIALEWYFDNHTVDTPWYWASAGKTLTAFTTGIAIEEGHLSLSDKTSAYLGQGWTSTTANKEDLITVWHQLTMTSGLDETQGDC